MLGLSKRQIAARFDEIVEFAELQDFIDAPVKTYSSGMYMRLGFAVAIHVDPDVLLVDEVLAVGDEGFTHKCLDKFAEFKRRGKTILLVTHSLGLVERFCDEALWLDGGQMKAMGDPKRVVGAYITDVEVAGGAAAGDRRREGAGRRGDLPGRAGGRRAAGPSGRDGGRAGRHVPRHRRTLGVARGGDHRRDARRQRTANAATCSTAASAWTSASRCARRWPIDDFVIGIGIFNAEGVCCFGTNTGIEDLQSERIFGDAEAVFTIESLDLVEGTYKLDVAVHKRDGYPYDYHRLLYTFRVKSRRKDVGIYRPRHEWRFSEGIALTRTGGDTA